MNNLEMLEAKPAQLAPKYSRQLELIHQLSRVIGSGEKIEIILHTTLQQLLRILGYKAAQIYRLSPSGKELWLYLDLGLGISPMTETANLFSIDEDNIISAAIRTGEPVYLPNIAEVPYTYYLSAPHKTRPSIHSDLAVPLKHGQSCLGVLRVQSNKIDSFDESDISFLSSLAALLAAAIQNAQTMQQLQDDLQEIKILYSLQHHEELSRQSQSTSPKSALGYEYNRTTISAVDELSPLAQQALAHEQSGVSITHSGTSQELFAPIKLNDETIGVISVENALDKSEWTPDDVSFLEEISSQVALAIENSRLLQQTQERTKELSLLFETSRQLSETIDLQQIYDILVSQLINYLQADICQVLLFDAARTRLESLIIKSRNKAQQVVNSSASRREVIEDVAYVQPFLQNPDPLIQHVDDLRANANSSQALKRPFRSKKLRTLVTFPLIARHRLIGVLEVGHNYHRDYSRNELQLAQAIIARVTVAIENAQLFQQTQTALSETQKLYDISRSLVECTDLEEVFNVVIENVKAYDIDRVSISLVDRNQAGIIEGVTIAASWDKESDKILPVGAKISAETFSLVHAFAHPPFHPLVSEDLRQAEGQDERLDEAFRLFMHQGLGAVTLFSAPMFLGAEYKGVLSISTRRPHKYTKEEARIYQTLADQAIIAIENHRLLEATQQNLHYSQILSRLSQKLLIADAAETIYDLTLEAIAATNPDRGAAILMYNQVEGDVELEMVGLWNNPRQEWPVIAPGARFSTETLGLNPLLKTGQTVTSTKATEDERFTEMLRQLLTIMQINTLAAVPVWLNREVGGFILIGHQTVRPFAPELIRLYEDIARQMSSALENRRLFEEVQYRATLLQTVAEVSQAATSSLDLPSLLPQTVELIRERFGFYHVSVYLVDAYQKYAVVEASTGAIGQQLLNIKHRLAVGGKSIVGAATKTGKPRLARNFGREAVYFNNPLLPESQSEIALPLVARGRVIGALDVHSTRRGAFSASDITILQSMADQLTNAIEAARALQAARDALAETSKVHEFYLREQWATFLQNQAAATGYRLTEQGLFTTEDAWPSDQIAQVIETRQPVILTGHTGPAAGESRPPGDNGAVSLLPAASGEESPNTSILIAPLNLQGQAVIGAVSFETSDPERVWDEDELEIVAAVTSQAAQAIEAVRLFEQTQAAREEAEALYQVGRALVATENEQEMLHTVLGAMLSILGLKQGGVLFFEEDGKFGKLHALFEEGRPVQPNMRIPVEGNPSLEKLIAAKQPVVITDFASDPLVAPVRALNLGQNIASLLLVPIIVNDKVIGAVGADAVGKRHIFSEREINLARAMADQLSLMLENRRLLEDARRRAIQLQVSSEVSQVATSILDQELMLSQAVELIRERFGFYHVQIFLIDEAKQYAVLYKSTGQAGQKLLEMKHKLAVGSQSVIGQVAYQRKPIVVRDTDLSAADTLYHRNEFLPDTRAELAIPLQVGDALIGALDVQSVSPNAFSEEDISTLEILAAQLAIAIQNARAFAEQQRTAERLKEIDKLKTQFLANMSHELRTPLNSIIGFSRVILKGIDGPLTDLQKTDLTSIYNSGQHLLSLINNILDLSKIEAGKMELNFEEVELAPIIKSVMSTAVALVKDKPVTLYQEIPDDLPLIWADPTRMRQIILNLVSNACKFTDEGTITVRAQADHEKVTISVSDTGIGIPEDKLSSIFEEFTQVDASTTRKAGGTGLGLPISRHFVEMHNGRIWVESTLGHGSTFYLYIPIKHNNQPPPAMDVSEGEKNEQKKVIVAIDDDPSVITLYERFLERQDYLVIGVSQKHDILAQVKELAPSAILLDVLMPEKDGWAILRALKEDPLTKDIPVIICSIISDKNRGFSLGAADYLVKPIAEQELLQALKHLENDSQELGKVLVIDDQADDILLIRRILEAQSQYKIIEASNGKEGLELVQSVNPDLIILDLTMPEMDGFRVVEALKGNEKTRSIPIIIVSAKELNSAEQQLLTGQVEVLLRKGIFTENELLEDVSQALQRIHHAEAV